VPIVATRGGEEAAQRVLAAFLDQKIARYHELRSHSDEDVASGLSPYLHFGHISAHDVVSRLLARDGWSGERLAPKPMGGAKAGGTSRPRPKPSSTS
jgi:deoxyribodipyrimidine photo-lyase